MATPSAPPEEVENVVRSPELPFVSAIVGGIFAGRSITISGMVLPNFASNDKRFEIDLCCGLLINGDHMDNKALHFNPRFLQKTGWFMNCSGSDDNALVLNSYISGSWGTEERFVNPFAEGKPFTLRIMAFDTYFKISANGMHVCDYAYRVPIESIKTISVKGNIRVDSVEFQPPISVSADGIPSLGKPGPVPKQLSKIDKPELPFVSAIVGGIFAGRSITISGMVSPNFASNDKRFEIDLCCGLLINGDQMDNKALHFNPRFLQKTGWFMNCSGSDDNALVLNSYISGSWGTEERFVNPFAEGKPFTLRIMAFDTYFKISANGMHVCDYAYRVPIESIKTISVKGNIRVDSVEFQPPISVSADGIPSLGKPGPVPKQLSKIDKPVVPFKLAVPFGGFLSPQSVKFVITPFLSAERFTMNLMSKGEYLFHFRVDMPIPAKKVQGAVIRNSSKNGLKWLREERDFGKFPFNKGITSDVVFTAYGRSVAVDVDGAPFIKFAYRAGDMPGDIDFIMVDGDVILHRVEHIG